MNTCTYRKTAFTGRHQTNVFSISLRYAPTDNTFYQSAIENLDEFDISFIFLKVN